jgi:hypothetical protein
MASKKALQKAAPQRAKSAFDWSSGMPPIRTAAVRATQPNSQPASYLTQADNGTPPPPSPQKFQDIPDNLPGISAPPKFGSPPVTPPTLTLPPVSGQGTASQGTAAQWQPPANLPASGSLVGWTPDNVPPPSPMQFKGLPANLPGISGGLPAFGSAPVTPPAITPPPINR